MLMCDDGIVIAAYQPGDWSALMALRAAQLAEHGIHLAPGDLPAAPADSAAGTPEWDLDHMDQVYLRGHGGFWLAWREGVAVGQVGGQDVGRGAVELRRMYVRAAMRRRGIGTRLVETLIRHCRSHGVTAVELWTAAYGSGRRLYRGCGFCTVAEPGPRYAELAAKTGWSPPPGQVRMRYAGL